MFWCVLDYNGSIELSIETTLAALTVNPYPHHHKNIPDIEEHHAFGPVRELHVCELVVTPFCGRNRFRDRRSILDVATGDAAAGVHSLFATGTSCTHKTPNTFKIHLREYVVAKVSNCSRQVLVP